MREVEAFSVVEGQLESLIEDDEREILAQVALEVAELLGTDVAVRASELGLYGAGDSESAPEVDGTTEDAAWAQIAQELGAGADEDALVGPPADPAVARLLPAVSEDFEVAQEYRRLTQANMRTLKGDRLVRFWVNMQPENGPMLRLERAEAEEMLATITDIRLVMAQRLEINNSDDLASLRRQQASDELHYQQSGMLQISDALAWWQESLLSGLQMLGEER